MERYEGKSKGTINKAQNYESGNDLLYITNRNICKGHE